MTSRNYRRNMGMESDYGVTFRVYKFLHTLFCVISELNA